MINTEIMEKQFSAIGARVKVVEPKSSRWITRTGNEFTIDVKKDRKGEFFELTAGPLVDAVVLDTASSDRHLLLMTKIPSDRKFQPDEKMRFLCGHDERQFFVAGIAAPAISVVGAKQSLKPQELIHHEKTKGIKPKEAQKRHRRLGDGSKVHRQGEFMFVVQPGYQPPGGNLTAILRNEKMRGGGSHFHVAEYLYRSGGKSVWVRGTRVLSDSDYRGLSKNQKIGFQPMKENPSVYVKGKIKHVEHKTLDLGHVWHKMMVSTEYTSSGNAIRRLAGAVRFID